MQVRWRTNVDCAKRFMDSLPQNNCHDDCQPMVGDRIVVAKGKGYIVEMQIFGRTFTQCDLTKNWYLSVELGVPSWTNIPDFTDRLRSLGYPSS